MRPLLLLTGLLLVTGASAQPLVMEVIALHHRTAQEMIPLLRPLVPPPGAVTGLGNQLVVKTTAGHLADVKSVLADLDRARKRLLISVKRVAGSHVERYGDGGSLRIHGDGAELSAGRSGADRGAAGAWLEDRSDNRAELRTYRSDRRTGARGVQRVQTVEGSEAYIAVGESVPLRQRSLTVGPGGPLLQESTAYRDLTTGFFASARVNGDQVRVELRARDQRRGPAGAGSVASQETATVVAGPLDTWLPVGGVNQTERRAGSGILYSAGSEARERRKLMLKVEVLP